MQQITGEHEVSISGSVSDCIITIGNRNIINRISNITTNTVVGQGIAMTFGVWASSGNTPAGSMATSAFAPIYAALCTRPAGFIGNPGTGASTGGEALP